MDKKRLVKGIWVVFGSMIMGLGIAVTLKANVGVAPLSAFIEGISIKLDISMGWAAKLVMGLIVLVLLFIDRNRIGLGTLLNSFLVGSFVDYFMASNDLLYSQYMPVRFLWFAIGVVTMGIGIGLYISGGLGEAGIDSLMVLISEKTGRPVYLVRIVLDLLMILVAVILGGQVFIGTAIAMIVTGPTIGWTIRMFKKHLNWTIVYE